ncbi:MAG: thiol reductant ABC exporter subunit CydC [Devosia sp.]|nr:thiol reductant ABC exporter subunit CydC [Devosia sp.]
MKTVRFFLPLFLGQARWMLLALLLSLAAVIAGVGLLGSSGWFLTAAALSSAGVAFNIFAPSASVRGFSFLRILARYGERMAGHDGTLRLLSSLRGWLFARLFPLLPIVDRDSRHGDLVSRLTADVDALDTVFLVAIGPIVTSLVIGTAATVALAFLLPGAAIVYALAYAVAALLVPLGVLAATRRAGTRIVEETSALRVATLDALDGHADLIAFGALATAETSFGRASTALSGARRTPLAIAAIGAAAVQLATGTALLGTFALGLPAALNGALGMPVLVGILLAVIGSFEPTAVLVRAVGKLATAAAAAQRLQELATRRPSITDLAAPSVLPPGSAVAFQHVTFGYDADRPVLRDLDLAIAGGSHIAIIGTSGSGKSTLLKLLLRLAEPQGGKVCVAGVDVRTVPQASLHARVALLAQDAPVFHDTIRNNLLIGKPDASDAELWDALETSQLAAPVRHLPHGLDTVVGETGKTLSAGQARRLCLARTVLSPAPILAFDEPTSGLDSDNERAFFAALAAAGQGRTIVLVTHADLGPGIVEQTYRLEDGKLGLIEF